MLNSNNYFRRDVILGTGLQNIVKPNLANFANKKEHLLKFYLSRLGFAEHDTYYLKRVTKNDKPR